MKKALGAVQGLLIYFTSIAMLYDVLPPLALFLSFGGIIVLVSRVMLRMRHEEISQQIHAEVAAAPTIHEASLLQPGTKGVQLVKNRIAHGMASLRTNITDSIQSTRQAVADAKNRKRQKQDVSSTIQTPHVPVRDRIVSFVQSLERRMPNPKQRIAALRERVRGTGESTDAPVVTPTIRLVRHTVTETEKQPGKTSLMSKIVKREKEETPLEKAANEIANQHFDVAEDILVPYIMKHASDAKAYVLLGNAAIGRHSWEEAMEIFQQVIKLDSSICDAYAQLGHAALNAGKFTQAIEALQHARNLDATNIRVREELLVIAQRMDNKVVEKGVAEELAELKKEAA